MFGVLRFSNLLFWTMALVGGLTLAPCLVLPPLLEFEAQRSANREAAARNADLQRRLTTVTKKIESLRTDPSYRERLIYDEVGKLPPKSKLLDTRAPGALGASGSPDESVPASSDDPNGSAGGFGRPRETR